MMFRSRVFVLFFMFVCVSFSVMVYCCGVNLRDMVLVLV